MLLIIGLPVLRSSSFQNMVVPLMVDRRLKLLRGKEVEDEVSNGAVTQTHDTACIS